MCLGRGSPIVRPCQGPIASDALNTVDLGTVSGGHVQGQDGAR